MEHGLPVALEKGFGFGAPKADGGPATAAESFTTWGTHFDSVFGMVGVPPAKRGYLAMLALSLVSCPRIPRDLV